MFYTVKRGMHSTWVSLRMYMVIMSCTCLVEILQKWVSFENLIYMYVLRLHFLPSSLEGDTHELRNGLLVWP